jgi:hypothetical protein
MIGPNFLIYVSWQGQKDDAKVRSFASILKLAPYDAKVMLGAPGPRKVAAHLKIEDAERQVLELRQAGFTAILVDKQKFSRAPALFRAIRAVETPQGMTFSLEKLPDFELPKGLARAVVLGYYTESTRHTSTVGPRGFSTTISGTTRVRNPFIHVYSDDVHTVLDIRGPKFEYAWLDGQGLPSAELRWPKLAERLAAYYGAFLDTTLFKYPDEIGAITMALNVAAESGKQASASTGGDSLSDDTPLALAASRVIVQCRVYGL